MLRKETLKSTKKGNVNTLCRQLKMEERKRERQEEEEGEGEGVAKRGTEEQGEEGKGWNPSTDAHIGRAKVEKPEKLQKLKNCLHSLLTLP